MAAIVSLIDVQHWGACRRVVLARDTTLTAAAQRWLADRGIEVEIEEEDASDPEAAASPALAGEDQAEPLAMRSAVREIMQEQQSEAELGDAADAGAALSPPGRLERAIITVLGKDRVGIIATIASLLAARQANVLDINQTLFGDLFSMTMAVDISQINVSFADLKEALEKAGDELRLKVLTQRAAVFDYMHRV